MIVVTTILFSDLIILQQFEYYGLYSKSFKIKTELLKKITVGCDRQRRDGSDRVQESTFLR